MFTEFLNSILNTKRKLWLLPHKIRSGRKIASYLRRNAHCVKVNIGSGAGLLKGWLNGDSWPFEGTVYIDALRKLPFNDESVDFINCEHMLEHLEYGACEKFLAECRRVLKKGGVLRISTPNLTKLVGIYLGQFHIPPSKILEHYNLYHNAKVSDMCQWFNDHFYRWGHRFIFDETSMKEFLTKAGFFDVTECVYGESRHPELCGVEGHDEGVEWTKNGYTMIFEAEKRTWIKAYSI